MNSANYHSANNNLSLNTNQTPIVGDFYKEFELDNAIGTNVNDNQKESLAQVLKNI